MALNSDQLSNLRTRLESEKAKLESVLQSIDVGDPAQNGERVDNNADAGTDAIEENDLVRSESLRRETTIMMERIDDSLRRMSEGSYGKTDDGEDIPFERLEIDPTATTNVA
ncbi:MAG TPA: hypothetical protein VLH19_01630 [Patescibacteria group bacterium]|nr:hypothetical protein [Patescibacteria group bacterium]